jgi:glycolate oxidase iron-sulfur subunit
VFNLLHPEMAGPIGEEKAAAIRRAAPDIVLTANPGCVLQIRAGLAGSDIEVLHPIDLLDRSYELGR